MGKKSWYSTGFKKVREKKESKGGGGNFFSLKDGDEADVRFLDEEPVCIYEHFVRVGSSAMWFTCLDGTGEECPACEKGIAKRFSGSFSVIDRRDDKVKLYKAGIRVLKVLDKINTKKGLTRRDVSISRTGGGTDTQYNFMPGDKAPMEGKDKKKEKLDLEMILKPRGRKKMLEFMESSKTEDDDDDEDDVKF